MTSVSMFKVHILNAYKENGACLYVTYPEFSDFVGLRRTWHWKACEVKIVYAFNSGSCCFFITPNRLLKPNVTEYQKFPLP
jgi:hypothetical protein